MTKPKNLIVGHYGVEEGEITDFFKILLEEVKLVTAVTPSRK